MCVRVQYGGNARNSCEQGTNADNEHLWGGGNHNQKDSFESYLSFSTSASSGWNGGPRVYSMTNTNRTLKWYLLEMGVTTSRDQNEAKMSQNDEATAALNCSVDGQAERRWMVKSNKRMRRQQGSLSMEGKISSRAWNEDQKTKKRTGQWYPAEGRDKFSG